MLENLRPKEDVLQRIEELMRELQAVKNTGSRCEGCQIDKGRCPLSSSLRSAAEPECPVPFFHTGWFSYRSEKFGN